MIDDVRPLRFVGASGVQAVHEAITAALAAWSMDWCSSATRNEPVRVEVAAVETGNADWPEPLQAWRCGPGKVWFGETGNDQRRLQASVLGQGGTDAWLAAVVAQGRIALRHAVCAALSRAAKPPEPEDAPSPLPPEFQKPGSGALRITCHSMGLRVVSAWEVAEPLLASAVHAATAREPVRTLDGVLERVQAPVAASLGSLSLDVATLLTLNAGDVLRLPRRLDDGVDLICGRTVVCRALLGEDAGSKAVQVLPPLEQQD